MVKWIQYALDVVPADMEMPSLEAPHEGGTELGPVPDDLMPILRAWHNDHEMARRLGADNKRDGHRGAADALAAMALSSDDPAKAETVARLVTEALRIEASCVQAARLLRRAQCLNRIVYIGIEAFYADDYAAIGIVSTPDGLRVVGYTSDEVASGFESVALGVFPID